MTRMRRLRYVSFGRHLLTDMVPYVLNLFFKYDINDFYIFLYIDHKIYSKLHVGGGDLFFFGGVLFISF